MNQLTPKEAYKFVGNWAASETHKRTYPMEELEKLSQALMRLEEFFKEEEA